MKSLGLIVDQRKGGAGACLGAGRVHQATCGWNLRFFNPCNGSTPEEDPCNSKRQGGGFGGAQIALMYPGRRFLVELATPGGLRSPKTSIIQSACNCFYTTIPLPPPFLRLKPGKFGNKTGAVPSPLCPNFRRLDQSMQITAATAIAFAFETAKDCWGIVPSSDYLSSE